MTNNMTDASYIRLLDELKQRVASGRYKAAISANKELLLLYHYIGSKILKAQERQGWGAKIIEKLGYDLRTAFPEMKGFSSRNLKYMRKFAQEYPDSVFVQEVLAQLTWYHVVTVMFQTI